MNSARMKAYAALVAAALIWGAAQPLVKPALQFVSPLQFMFLRYLVAMPIGVIVLITLLRHYRPDKYTLLKILGIEIVALINLAILYTGLQHTTALHSALILNARPIFITLMGIWLLREREEKHEWIGLLLSVTGIAMVILSPYMTNSPQTEIMYRGNMLVVLTNVIFVITTYLSKRTYKKIPKVFVSGLNSVYGLGFFWILNMGIYGQLPLSAAAHSEVLVPMLYMGILGTVLASALSIYGYTTIEASEASLFAYLEPLIYIPMSIFWLQEPLLPFQILGLMAIIGGVVVAAARFPHSRKRLPLFHGLPRLKTIHQAEEPFPLHNHLGR